MFIKGDGGESNVVAKESDELFHAVDQQEDLPNGEGQVLVQVRAALTACPFLTSPLHVHLLILFSGRRKVSHFPSAKCIYKPKPKCWNNAFFVAFSCYCGF
jgi:hypothetical protein